MSHEVLQQALEALEKASKQIIYANVRPERDILISIAAIREALAQPEQETNKNGSPCSEFWDWLPKAYNFEGNGNFTKYNMEVAFLAGKQASQPEQEPVAFPSRRAVERAIESVENPKGMHLNDGKERVVLPGGTLRYMLALIDHTSPPQRQPLNIEKKLMCWSRATCDADVEHKTEHQCLMDYGSEIEAKHGIGDKT